MIYICDFQYPLSYEHIIALLLYTDLYVVVFKLLIVLVGKIFWVGVGQLPPPPVPTAMYNHHLIIVYFSLLQLL